MLPPVRTEEVSPRYFAPGVERVEPGLVNAFLVGDLGEPWVLVDTGFSFSAPAIRRAAEKRFGEDAPPAAIVLTHGHPDHAGSAAELASWWDVPIFAHLLELPYLNGDSDYPPQDPTVGGVLGPLSRLGNNKGLALGPRLQPLPEDGTVPGLPGWRWLPTPGHSPGHVSLFREADRTLLAGDALATLDLNCPLGLLTRERKLCGPPAPFTANWPAARESLQQLATLQPQAIGAGHGHPVRGRLIAEDLRQFAAEFRPPAGRYSITGAVTDEFGIVELPPAGPDPLPARLLAAGAAAVALAGLLRAARSARN